MATHTYGFGLSVQIPNWIALFKSNRTSCKYRPSIGILWLSRPLFAPHFDRHKFTNYTMKLLNLSTFSHELIKDLSQIEENMAVSRSFGDFCSQNSRILFGISCSFDQKWPVFRELRVILFSYRIFHERIVIFAPISNTKFRIWEWIILIIQNTWWDIHRRTLSYLSLIYLWIIWISNKWWKVDILLQ